MTYLTNEMMKAECPPGLCPGCFGWGFPVYAHNGREAKNIRVVCPDCGGTGKPKTAADQTRPGTARTRPTDLTDEGKR